MSCVMCHMSLVIRHMLRVMRHMSRLTSKMPFVFFFLNIFFYNMAMLVSGGSFINGAYPIKLFLKCATLMLKSKKQAVGVPKEIFCNRKYFSCTFLNNEYTFKYIFFQVSMCITHTCWYSQTICFTTWGHHGGTKMSTLEFSYPGTQHLKSSLVFFMYRNSVQCGVQ